MRLLRCLALCAALYSCAAQNVDLIPECSREAGLSRGARDAKAGRASDTGFLENCLPENRAAGIAAYREAFEAAAKTKRVKEDAESAITTAASLPPSRKPAAQSWVCEVEANSKIFTGSGASKAEALGAAKSTCVSHFQPSYCNESECKQNL